MNEPTYEQFDGWARGVARSMVGLCHPLFDDLVQEAHIVWWRIGSVPELWVTARWRMVDMAAGLRPPTGGDSKPGPKYRPKTVTVDWTDETVRRALDPEIELLLDLESRGPEVREAVASLNAHDRWLVYRRFWLDQPWTDKAESNRWNKYVRPKLARKLA